MKLQAAVIFTSLQNAKMRFTCIVGYTSCRPTYFVSFITIFGQCINVLHKNNNKQPLSNRYFVLFLWGIAKLHTQYKNNKMHQLHQ